MYAILQEIKDNLFDGVDKKTEYIVNAFYKLIYEPPRADFIPTFETNHIKGLS